MCSSDLLDIVRHQYLQHPLTEVGEQIWRRSRELGTGLSVFGGLSADAIESGAVELEGAARVEKPPRNIRREPLGVVADLLRREGRDSGSRYDCEWRRMEFPCLQACLQDGVRQHCLEDRSAWLPRDLDLHHISVRSAPYHESRRGHETS